MRFFTALLCLLAIAACDDSSAPVDGLVSPLQGLVYLEEPVAGAQVTLIVETDDGAVPLDETQTDEAGAFNLNTSAELGPFRIEVQPPGRTEVLTHFVHSFDSHAELLDARVHISPITAISAGLAQRLFEDALEDAQAMSLSPRQALDAAIDEADVLINAHFFEVHHAGTLPKRLAVQQDQPDLSTPGVLAGLALDGLAELTRLLAQRANVSADGIVTLSLLTAALADDIRADAIFDGQGLGGPILVLNQFLDSHTLRRDFALALLRFIESDRDVSRFGRADIRRFADACADSQAVIFPPDISSQLEADPPLVTVTPKDGSVVSGQVFTEITSADAHLIDRVETSAAPGDFPWRPIEGPDDEFNDEELLWYRYDYLFGDTTARPDGAYTVTVVAVDELDNATREEVRWIVDNTPPTVEIEAPRDGAILSGEERRIVARAIDINGLAAFSVTTPDGVVHHADIPEPGDDVISPTEAELVINYNSLREVDGIYSITAIAEDVVRNSADAAIEVQVDNAAPEIRFESPRNTDVVEGLVPIVVVADDAAPIASFVITTPDGEEHDFQRNPDGEWRAELQWDSTVVRDGPDYPISASVIDAQGNEGQATIAIEVNNVDEGVATGVAHFDSPVPGLVIEAWTIGANPDRVDLCAQSREGLCVTDEDGTFEIEIADNYVGPLLLKAIADQNTFAEYVDAATGEIAGINDFDLRTLIVEYQPGQRYEGLVFSAASTLTADWLLATLQPDGDITAQARASILAWGQHLCPVGPNEAPCDPTSTRPQRYDGTDDEFVPQSSGALLGLVQAGLARRAADLRMRFDEPPFWAVGLLKRFRRDMEDGVLDGKRGEELIQVDNHPRDHRYLGACSLRSGLAAGMGSFLNKTRLLDIDVAARNQTEIDKENMTVYLEGVSTRVNRAVWGPIFIGGRIVYDYCEYDGEAPEIIVTQPQTGDLFGPNGGRDTADWTMRIRALAEDSAGLGEMWLTFDDQIANPDFEVLNPSPENFIAEFFYEGLAEGPTSFSVNVSDLAGNLGSIDVTPEIDLTPPEVQVLQTQISHFDPITGEVVYRLANPIETSEDNPLLTANRTIVLGIIANEPITISGTDAADIRQNIVGFHYFVTFNLNPGIDRLALSVGDRQGNTTRQDIWVLRDDEGPSIELVDSGRYQPEDALRWREADCVGETCSSIRFSFDESVRVPPAELQLGERGIPHAFTKFYQNWDGAITGRPNLPSLNFRWEDELGQGVTLDYRVLAGQAGAEGSCCTNVRFEPLGGWTVVPANNGNVSILIEPDTIDDELGLIRNRIYRVEARITNRAGVAATTAALFTVRLIAPPINAWLDGEQWRNDGFGVGGMSFDNPDELIELCAADSPIHRRISNIKIYNPWPYPIHVSASGRISIEQYNRKAWVLDRRGIVREPCLGALGLWRATNSDTRCYDNPSQIPGIITPRTRVHRESERVSPAVTQQDVALPRDGQSYILAPGQHAEVEMQAPVCNLPFLPPDLSLPRPHRLRIERAHPDEHRVLDLSRRRPGVDGRFDRYEAVERVSQLRFEMADMQLRVRPPIDAGQRAVWHEEWTDSYDIDNPAYTLPGGLEGED